MTLSRTALASVSLVAVAAMLPLLSTKAAPISVGPKFNPPQFVAPTAAAYAAVLPDGKFLRYGFADTTTDRSGGPISRYLPDGTLDESFKFTANFTAVQSAAPLPDGKLLIGADQSIYGGGSANGLTTFQVLRLNADGSVDPTFSADPVADNTVHTFNVLADGRILVSGYFTHFAGTNRQGIVRLLSDGTLDSSFDAGAIGRILGQPVVQPDNKILVVGDSLSGGVARLNLDGSRDAGFTPSGYSAIRVTRAVVLQANGNIVLAGRFTVPTDTSSGYPLVFLSSSGALLHPAGSTQAEQIPLGLAQQADGKLVLAGFNCSRFLADGTPDDSFGSHSFSGGGTISNKVEIDAAGKIVVSGFFAMVDGTPRLGLVRFNSDGSIDSLNPAVKPAFILAPNEFVRLSDASTLVTFYSFEGDAVPHNFARLLPDGSVDTTFNPAAKFSPSGWLRPTFEAQGVKRLPSGKFFVWGDQANFGRLNPDFSEDTTFHAEPFSIDWAFGLPDGKILVGLRAADPYTLTGGSASVQLSRVNADGSRDGSFNLAQEVVAQMITRDSQSQAITSLAGLSTVLAVQRDGRILFSYLGTDGNFHLVRLKTDGSLDPTFKASTVLPTGLTQTITTVNDWKGGGSVDVPAYSAEMVSFTGAQILPNGKIVVVGSFRSFAGQEAHGIVRLNANGTVDTTFHPGAAAEWVDTPDTSTTSIPHPMIDQVALQANGDLLITGTFEAFDGTPAPGITSLHPDGTVDKSFVAPVTRVRLGVADPNAALAQFPLSKLEKQTDGSFLLSGPYDRPGSTNKLSFIRLLDTPPGIANISTRASIGTGDRVLISGFIITGSTPKSVLIRGIGPSIKANGAPLPGTLQDPTLKLYDASGGLLNSNDDWRTDQEQALTATGAAPTDDREPALLVSLNPGTYTASVQGKDNAAGIGLVEVYDLAGPSDPAVTPKIANLSTRGFVGSGDDVLIGGFIVSDSAQVVIRAIGPELTDAGVADALQDTTLDLFDANGTAVGSNDDWGKAANATALANLHIAPKDSREAAILTTLSYGSYTAIVRGKGGATGVALVELYSL